MNRFSRVVLLLTIAAVLGAPAPSFPWPIPDTGQTKCSNNTTEIPCPQEGEDFYGQDGNYLINAPSYTKLDKNGNELPDDASDWVMVRDNVTGLIWEVKHNRDQVKNYSDPHDADNTYTWYDPDPTTNGGDPGTHTVGMDTKAFIDALNAGRFGGFDDWRVPSIQELTSIVDYGRLRSAINTTYFPNTFSSYYWSSTTYASRTDYAWRVDFDYGHDHCDSKSSDYYVRAARGGQSGSFSHLVINGDGTVTDTSSGLMWQQATEDLKIWGQALARCESLLLADYSDWRLPNVKELHSIVDYARYNPAINATYFPNTLPSLYWSSTTDAPNTDSAWGVFFLYGYGSWGGKYDDRYVRAVRAGQNRLSDHLFISAPRQGSAWKVGDEMVILWKTEDISSDVQISISRQGGRQGSFEIIEESTENDGTCNWIVTGLASVNCVLKIEPVDELSKGTSLGLFTICDCPPIVTTNDASFVGSDVATLNGTVNPNFRETTVTFEWGTNETYDNEISAAQSPLTGETSQNVTADLTDLDASVTYHCRVKAANFCYTIYGEDQTFTTNEAIIPTITTAPVVSITSKSASSGGEVLSDGGTEVTSRGVCWSTSANPTVSDAMTSDGTGLGIFTSSMEGLNVATTYHVRAYATNSKGTAYGDDQMFITSKICVTCVASKTELQNALDRARDNEDDDIIRIVQGTYYGNFTYTPTDADDQANSLTLEGGYTSKCTSRVIAPTNTVLDGGKNGRVLELITQGKADFFLEGLTLRNGVSTHGAGLFTKTDGHVTLRNNTLSKNTYGAYGGGAYITSSSTLYNNIFIGNTVKDSTHGTSGGGVWVGSNGTLTNNTFTENAASVGGGACVGNNCTLINGSSHICVGDPYI